jgi:putative transposase
MPFDPNRHHRRSIRLQGYDYTLTGAYFVTLCTWDRSCLFGDIVDAAMAPSAFGLVVASYWEKIVVHAAHVSLDASVLMPNHVHGILVLTGDHRAEAESATTEDAPFDPAAGDGSPAAQRPHGTQPGSLGAVLQNWKSTATRRINQMRHTPEARVWQDNYFEHIIRNERELWAIRQYIENNPAQWAQDRERPQNARRRL